MIEGLENIKKANLNSGDKIIMNLPLNYPTPIIEKVKAKIIEIDDIIKEYEAIKKYAIKEYEKTNTSVDIKLDNN